MSLAGRDADLAVIRAFVDEIPTRGGALLIAGDAGVGKSALVEDVGSYAVSAGLSAAECRRHTDLPVPAAGRR
jgi:hypothetical protein